MGPLLTLVICLLTAMVLGEVLSYFRCPRVVGQVLAGMILGIPLLRGLIFDDQSLQLISYLADIGVIILLFFTGLEINFKSFYKNLKTSSGMSFWNTLIPLLLGFGICLLFGLSPSVSFIVGVCLSVSATALSLDMLEELNMLRTKLGALIVGSGTVDDVFELGLITVAIAMIETLSAKAALLTLLLNAAIFVTIIFAFRGIVAPFILKFAHKRTHATLLMSGMILTLLMAGLSDLLGFGTLLGALISGVLIRQILLTDAQHHRPWEAHSISKHVHTLGFGFLVPMFFIKIGLMTDITKIWENFAFGSAITIVAIFGTVIGSALGYYMLTKKWSEGIMVGWAMNAKGDTELVIANLALESGIITSAIFSSLIFMAIVSTLISPLAFRYLLEKRKNSIN